MDGAIKIGRGKIAEVYLSEGFAYKVFGKEYPQEWIAYEIDVQSELLEKTTLPLARFYDSQIENSIKMDFLEGPTLAERMRKERNYDGLADLMETQQIFYKYSGLLLEDAHQVFTKRIERSRLTEELKDKSLSALGRVEKKNILCHFDMHFLNLIYSQNKYYIIDCINARLANPVLDIAKTYAVCLQYAVRYSGKYIRSMAKNIGAMTHEVRNALTAMAAVRLLETDSAGIKDKLENIIKSEASEIKL